MGAIRLVSTTVIGGWNGPIPSTWGTKFFPKLQPMCLLIWLVLTNKSFIFQIKCYMYMLF